MQMVQNILLIWLDNNIDDNSADCRNTTIQLRRAANSINTFTDRDQCIDFLTDIHNENVCMIISGALCSNVVPLIHDVAQLHNIFIYCSNKTEYEQWVKDWSKIKGVFTEISSICESLKQVAQQCEQNAIPISFMATNDDLSRKKLDQLEPSFMYTQILKEILLTIVFEQKHFTEFIDYCREVLIGNEGALENVTKFQRKYRDETPIWWYTFECFLYSMLNRALRLMNVDVIIKMVFFICDLHRHIKELHSEQFDGQKADQRFTVYRGQGMSKTDFEQLAKTKGGLISFNNFLSTSKDREISLLFAESNQSNPDLVGILFVMTTDPSLSSAPFASINSISHFQVEDEVLFAMHTVFRIGDITPMCENNRLFQVELTLTSDNDQDLRILTDHIQKEAFSAADGWSRLGLVLLKMGHSDKAQQIYEILLEHTTKESEKALIYNQLGMAKWKQGEYQEAITFFEKDLEISQKSLPPNHPDLGKSYNNIGNMYGSMGEYSKALLYYEKDLEIRNQSLPSNHPDLAMSYNNIGVVYGNMGEYSRALSSHEKVLEIRKQSLPLNHPDLAMSYNNIGNVYFTMGNYSKARWFYEKSLEMRKQSLPSNHPDLAMSYGLIGNVYSTMGEYSKALSSHEKALEIRKQLLPPNHPDLAMSYNNIGNVYYNMGEYSKALSYYEKDLEIRKQSLLPNHPDLAMSYSLIGNVYSTMGEYSKALSFCERAMEIGQQSLPSSHPHLQWYRNNLNRIKKKL